MDPAALALLLFAIALLAGLVDAIAGGGGLITLPALLSAGLGPVEALATNKAQGFFGTLASTAHFLRAGSIELRRSITAVICTFLGAAAGAIAVQFVASDLLAGLIPLLLIGFGLYFLLSPRVSDLDSHRRIGDTAFALTVGTVVGFYDGFFGPGTGTFFAMGYIALLGHGLRRATAHAKLLNLTSNSAAILLFSAGGQVVWSLGLPMVAGQLVGGWIGAHLVNRHGARLVRPILVAVSLAVSVKLLLN
ncbi:TSUP family transporter [Thiohalocapsa marina]|uniref:TSUP family transporter n=1 Tax=Thiohalocapsa marina TaxID=424902 RepID=UPI0036DDE29B